MSTDTFQLLLGMTHYPLHFWDWAKVTERLRFFWYSCIFSALIVSLLVLLCCSFACKSSVLSARWSSLTWSKIVDFVQLKHKYGFWSKSFKTITASTCDTWALYNICASLLTISSETFVFPQPQRLVEMETLVIGTLFLQPNQPSRWLSLSTL